MAKIGPSDVPSRKAHGNEKLSRREAIECGKTRYFTGKPCSRGHVLDRWVASYCCIECARINEADYAARNPQRNATKRGTAYLRPGYYNDIRLRRLERQAGRPKPLNCEVCYETNIGGQGIVFDHCHETGQFRGWLCDRCNKVLGHVKDNPEVLLKLATFLEEHRGKAKQRAA